MTIYLNPEIRSGLGEDTFWTWFEREFDDACFGVPEKIDEKNDLILQYSTLSEVKFPNNTISLCWELYPEMRDVFQIPDYDEVINRTINCAKNSFKRIVSTNFARKFYEEYGNVDILPIGVNTELFKPLNKEKLRKKYSIPLNKKIGFWMGTNHPMKGFDNLEIYRKLNPEIEWIVVWKDRWQSKKIDFGYVYTCVNQETLAELINCADFFLCCGLLRPYFMVEYEAMACNIPFVMFDEKLSKDFILSKNPRDEIFKINWDRNTAKKIWRDYIDKALSEINPNYQNYNNKINEITKNSKVSIVSLIYKSTKYADFVYESLKKHTPILQNEGSEFFFIANDASDEVIDHLNKKNYKYYVNNNIFYSERHLLEKNIGCPEYINRVYNGWNEAIKKSKNEIVVLVNSDMAFSPFWLENLLKNLNENSYVCSQLVEHSFFRGTVFPGAYDKFFGYNPQTFSENLFIEYSKYVRRKEIKVGGAFMPCAFYKKNISDVGYFPEGNISKNNNFFEIEKYGDEDLISRLNQVGINHITSLDSVIYHFNEGEMRDEEYNNKMAEKINLLKSSDNIKCSEDKINNLIFQKDYELHDKIDELVNKKDYELHNKIDKLINRNFSIKRLIKNIKKESHKLFKKNKK